MTDSSEISNLESIRQNHWRQGSIASVEVQARLKSYYKHFDEVTEVDLLIVLTQDCDLVHADLTSEPYAELLIARVTKPEDRKEFLFWGRNPRLIQFELESNGRTTCYQASIHDRRLVDRSLLVGQVPSKEIQLPSKILRSIREWITRRYHRQGFPDEFNLRLEKAKEKIQKALRGECADSITGVYLTVIDDELPKDESYKIDITMTMDQDEYANGKLRAKVQLVLDRISAAMGACLGIDVGEPALLSEANVSIADLRILKRWDYDWISVKNDSK